MSRRVMLYDDAELLCRHNLHLTPGPVHKDGPAQVEHTAYDLMPESCFAGTVVPMPGGGWRLYYSGSLPGDAACTAWPWLSPRTACTDQTAWGSSSIGRRDQLDCPRACRGRQHHSAAGGAPPRRPLADVVWCTGTMWRMPYMVAERRRAPEGHRPGHAPHHAPVRPELAKTPGRRAHAATSEDRFASRVPWLGEPSGCGSMTPPTSYYEALGNWDVLRLLLPTTTERPVHPARQCPAS